MKYKINRFLFQQKKVEGDLIKLNVLSILTPPKILLFKQKFKLVFWYHHPVGPQLIQQCSVNNSPGDFEGSSRCYVTGLVDKGLTLRYLP